MHNLRMRVMRDTDVPVVARLNAAAIPAVNDIGESGVEELRGMCEVQLVAANRDNEVVAFILSLGPGHPYASENYRWFEERGRPHQYIDRIVVDPRAKGTGVGRAMYESVFQEARERGISEVTCEINLRPANPGSMAFHERMGFQRMHEQETKGGTVRVALMSRYV